VSAVKLGASELMRKDMFFPLVFQFLILDGLVASPVASGSVAPDPALLVIDLRRIYVIARAASCVAVR
jgi:hypothetical protein